MMSLFHYLKLLNLNIFFSLHSLTQKFPEYQRIFSFLADKLDTFVLMFAFFLFSYFVYQSIEHVSWKRFCFLLREGVRIAIAIFSAWGISYFIKELAKVPRPYLQYPHEVHPLFPYGSFDSFPSGHATLFMALAVIMILHHKRVGYLFLFFAILISLMRIIAGVHFPVDILFGWIIGGGVSYFVYKKVRF